VPAEDEERITYRAQRTDHDVRLVQWRERRAAIQREIDWLYSQRFEREHRQAAAQATPAARPLRQTDRGEPDGSAFLRRLGN
jgi:hypothetical protein